MKKLFSLSKNDQKLALLIDPDWASDPGWLNEVLINLNYSHFDLILVGGSIVKAPDTIDALITHIKDNTDLPVYLFPGNVNQISKNADGILFISLISGRNPEFLIGQHVLSAPLIKSYRLHVLSTGYMLIGDSATSAHYMSQTQAIPYTKNDIALATALAGELLGMQCIYMDGGSGPKRSPSKGMIKTLSEELEVPLIVGGGVKERKQIDELFSSGANMVVIGSAIEKNPSILEELSPKIKEPN
jgi:putative glycerol-1-phosphate prenyltransferase